MGGTHVPANNWDMKDAMASPIHQTPAFLGAAIACVVLIGATPAQSNQVVYIRLFGEMNGYWNPYSAFNADGSSRGQSHSTSAFRKAWRRIVLIVRGGNRKTINRKLRKQDMPRIYRADSNHDPVY